MAYKITVQDGPVTVTVETDVVDDAAAVLAVSVLQKVQHSRHFDPPSYPWRGPDYGGGKLTSPNYSPGTVMCGHAYAAAEAAVARQQL